MPFGEGSLKLAIAEKVCAWASRLRKVTEITEQLCGLEIYGHPGLESRAGMLDEELEEFRSRELGEYPSRVSGLPTTSKVRQRRQVCRTWPS